MGEDFFQISTEKGLKKKKELKKKKKEHQLLEGSVLKTQSRFVSTAAGRESTPESNPRDTCHPPCGPQRRFRCDCEDECYSLRAKSTEGPGFTSPAASICARSLLRATEHFFSSPLEWVLETMGSKYLPMNGEYPLGSPSIYTAVNGYKGLLKILLTFINRHRLTWLGYPLQGLVRALRVEEKGRDSFVREHPENFLERKGLFHQARHSSSLLLPSPAPTAGHVVSHGFSVMTVKV